MKKKSFRVIVIILVLIILYFVVPGFMKNQSVVIDGYTVSADGKEITLNVSVASSMGYIRNVKIHQQQGGKLYLDFYSAFGGPNGFIGAKKEYTVPLDEDTSIIAVYRNPNAYEEVLVKASDGTCQRTK